MFSFRRLAPLFAACFALLASALPAGARSNATAQLPEVGVQFHATWSDYSDAERAEVVSKLSRAGVGWVRIDVGWQSLQERNGRSMSDWYVRLTDRAVDMARARGMKVLLTLWTTPGWANNGAGKIAPPDDPQAYANIARWAAEHFRGRVQAWEIWNEPNHPSYFRGDAADYVKLLKAAYPAIKAGDPNALVVLGGPSYNDTNWLADVYAAGAKDFFDVMSTHPYQGIADAPPETRDDGSIYTLSHVAAVKRLMNRRGDRQKPIWFTELGWSSHPNRGNEKNWDRGVTLREQAAYFVRTLEHVKANYPYVTNVFWYAERNQASGDPQLDNYGLLNRDLSPKPVYSALKDYLTRRLARRT